MEKVTEFPDVEQTQTQALVKVDPAGRYLVRLDQATRMLAEARTLDDITHVVGVAEMAKAYAKAANLGLEAHNHAAEINLRAQRAAGEMLAKLDKGQGGRPPKTADKVSEVSEYRRTIDEAQVPEKTATRWQQVAAVPGEQFEQFINHTKEVSEEVSTAGLLRDAKKRAGESATPSKKFADKWTDVAKVNQAMEALDDAIDHFLALRPDDGLLDYYPERKLLEIVEKLRRARTALKAKALQIEAEPSQGTVAVALNGSAFSFPSNLAELADQLPN